MPASVVIPVLKPSIVPNEMRQELELSGALKNDKQFELKDLLPKIPHTPHDLCFWLHQAISNRSLNCALLLIDRLDAVWLTKKDKEGTSPLEYAVYSGQQELACVMISKLSAEQLATQKADGTPLLLMALANKCDQIGLELIKKLPYRQLVVRDQKGDTPLLRSVQNRCNLSALALIERLAHHELKADLLESCTQIVALALIEKLPIEALTTPDRDGYRPLHTVLFRKDAKTCLKLANKLPPEELNIPDPHGRTPLYIHSTRFYSSPEEGKKLGEKLRG